MLSPFGCTSILATFQGFWTSSTAFTVTNMWGCTLAVPSTHSLIVSISSLPRSVPGLTPTASSSQNTRGVSDSTVLVQLEQLNVAPLQQNITYGPNTSTPLNANDVLISLSPPEGNITGMTLNGILWGCQDGSVTPETP